jgi:hypothetical protein
MKDKVKSKVKVFRKATKEEKEELSQGLLLFDKKDNFEDIVKGIELVSFVDCINNCINDSNLHELLFEE